MSSSIPSSVLATSMRTDTCGLLRRSDVGRTVRLGGWVHRSRDLGGLVFIDLRDRTGLVQLAFGPAWSAAAVQALAAAVGVESVVMCEGEVVAREADRLNPDMGTGEVEVRVHSLRVVGPAVTPALPVARGRGDKMPAEELRLLRDLGIPFGQGWLLGRPAAQPVPSTLPQAQEVIRSKELAVIPERRRSTQQRATPWTMLEEVPALPPATTNEQLFARLSADESLFALAIVGRETAETPDELRLAELRVRRASHLLAIVEAPRWRRD
jgi:hypothetical protein